MSQEKIISHVIRPGVALILNQESISAANKLLALASAAGIPIAAMLILSYSLNIEKVTDIISEYSDEDVEYPQDIGVMAALRQTAHHALKRKSLNVPWDLSSTNSTLKSRY